MAVNAGSSSLKFQLLEMPEEKLVTSGIVERIGMKVSVFTIKVNGEKQTETRDIENHTEAVKMLFEKLISLQIIASLMRSGVSGTVSSAAPTFSPIRVCWTKRKLPSSRVG